jgi:hypothetical protein
MAEREFTCVDCGITVIVMVQSAANDQDVCIGCSWLRNLDNDEEREMAKAFLNRTKVIE